LIAATRRVATQGPQPYQERTPSDRRSVIFSPQASSSPAYARVPDVSDRELATLLEHAGRFAQRPRSLAGAGHVVNR
jgi:hypothetical protein